MWVELKDGVVPEDKEYQIMDENKNVAFGRPAYFPFRTEGGNGRPWTAEVIPCEPYWDGSWIIVIRGGTLTSSITGKITHFREMLN